MKRKNIFQKFGHVLTACILMTTPLFLYGGTQNIDGVIQNTYTDDNGFLSFSINKTFITYESRGPNTMMSLPNIATTRIDNDTATIVNGKLVSLGTFKNAVEPGMHGHFYEDVREDIYITPDFTFGKLMGHDAANNEIEIKRFRTSHVYHYTNNPDTMVTENYSDQANFYIEDQASTESEAMAKYGKWVQVHPPRQQIIWVETDASDYDYSRLLSPENGERGSANSHTGMSYFKQYTDDGKIEIERNLEGDWIDDTIEIDAKSLDGKACPAHVGVKPGRKFVSVADRTDAYESDPVIRTRDDEIRGTISSVSGNSFTVDAEDWDGIPYTTTIDISSNARILLDGNDSSEAVIEAGRDVRIFPERTEKRIVVLNRRVPGSSSTYQPIAYFDPDKPNAVGNHEFTFDGSHSYDLDGSITSFEWDFGDGETATGEVVTHTFNNGNEYKKYKVVLTVTSSDGETDKNAQIIAVMPEKRKAEDLLTENLKHGLVHKEWFSGCDFGQDCGTPDILESVYNTFITTNAGLNEFTGYIMAPADGWYEFRLTALDELGSHTAKDKLWIGDWLVADNQQDPWGEWWNYDKKGDVYLEAGLHPITLQTYQDEIEYNMIGWSGPDIDVRRKTMDQLVGNGSDVSVPMRFLTHEDIYYNPDDYIFMKANISVDKKTGIAPFKVNMDASSSTGDIETYTWRVINVESGETVDTLTNVSSSYTFNNPGVFDLELHVENPNMAEIETVRILAENRDASDQYMGVSFNINDGDTDNKVLGKTMTAGVVPLMNWNNLGAMNENDVIENSLTKSTPIQLTSNYSREFDYLSNLDANDGDYVMRHYIMRKYKSNISFELTNIPSIFISQGYDVYVYTGNNHHDKDVSFVSVEGESYWIQMAARGVNWDGKYIRSTAFSEAAAVDNGDTATHVMFENLTSDSINITVGDSLEIAGVQIVTERNIEKEDQTIDFANINGKQTTDGPFDVYADASSDLMVNFSIVGGPASVSGNTITLDETAGVVTVKASQPGNNSYNPVETTQSFRVTDSNNDDQTITFKPVPDKSTTDPDFEVTATASSGLDVTVEVADGPATISGQTVSLTGETGYVTLKATQSGNSNYNPAPLKLEKFRVSGDSQLGIEIHQTSGGGMELAFVGTPGRSYTLQATTDLVNPNWVDLVRKDTGETGLYEYIDTDMVRYPSRFYRVVPTDLID